MGSRVLEHAMPSADSLYVARMKAAGCIVIGKTNMPEFGLGSHTIAQGPQSFVPAGLPAPGQFRIGWLGDLRDHLATERGVLPVCSRRFGSTTAPPTRAFRNSCRPAKCAACSTPKCWSCCSVSTCWPLPAVQVWPFDVRERWPREIASRTMDTYHRWMEVALYATFAGLPAISVPAGFDQAGRLPMGLQLIGKPGGERELLQLAAIHEQLMADVICRRPPEPA